jgi:hypothetical protein
LHYQDVDEIFSPRDGFKVEYFTAMVAAQKKIHVYTYCKTIQNKGNTHAGRKTL